MKDNKGQALVEFILIFPVLIFIILAIIDFGNIVIRKQKLESNLSEICDLYNNNGDFKKYISNNKLDVKVESNGDHTNILIQDSVKIKTPILNNIIGSNYKIESSRMIYNE